MVRWAARDQGDLGLDVITDGEAYRENMYYFYQKRVDGVTFETCLALAFGDAGFGIECPRVVGRIENPRFDLAHNWKLARDAAPAHVRVKQTVTGPHVLTRFSVNERKDLYPDDQALCRAWAARARPGAAGGHRRRLPRHSVRRADVDRGARAERMGRRHPQRTDRSPAAAVRVGLHVCGGNPRRKRVYFTKYTDLAPAFRKVKIDEVLLEHCTLGYDLMQLWDLWDFKGDLGLGVIDQRSDEIETVDVDREAHRAGAEALPARAAHAHQRVRLRPRAARHHARKLGRARRGVRQALKSGMDKLKREVRMPIGDAAEASPDRWRHGGDRHRLCRASASGASAPRSRNPPCDLGGGGADGGP